MNSWVIAKLIFRYERIIDTLEAARKQKMYYFDALQY